MMEKEIIGNIFSLNFSVLLSLSCKENETYTVSHPTYNLLSLV